MNLKKQAKTMANCKAYQNLSVKEKTEFIGRLVHCVQNNETAFRQAKIMIGFCEKNGVLTDVQILPEREYEPNNILTTTN